MNIEFDADSHAYWLDGERVPSVTEVLAAEGLTDYTFCNRQDRQRGSYVHQICAMLGRACDGLKHSPEELISLSQWDPEATREDLVPYGLACARFLSETGFWPSHLELPVGSRKWKICGTLDAVGICGRERWLVDYKTGRPLEAAFLQASLYAECLKETAEIEPDKLVVVWLQSDGRYQVLPPRPHPGPERHVALCAVNLYRWRKQNGLL